MSRGQRREESRKQQQGGGGRAFCSLLYCLNAGGTVIDGMGRRRDVRLKNLLNAND